MVNRCRLLVVESSRIVGGRGFQALRARAGRRSRWLLRAYVGGLLGLADPNRIASLARARLARRAGQFRPRLPRGGLKRLYWRLPPSIRTVLGRVVFRVVSSRRRPLVSVVVVRSGDDRGLAECLQSVRDQQYRHIECLVVDDGSGDSSRHVLDAVAGDSRFRMIGGDGNGAGTLADLSNIGLHDAQGELVTFLAPGERLTPTSIWSRLILYRFKDDGLLAGVACERRTRGVRRPARVRRGTEWIDLLTPPGDFPVSVGTILASTRMLRSIGGFDAGLGDDAFDPDLWVRVLRQGMVLYTTGEHGVVSDGDPDDRGEFTDRLEASPQGQLAGAAGPPRLRESPEHYRRMLVEARETCRRAAACHEQRDTAGFDAAIASLDAGLSGILARHVDIDPEIREDLLARADAAVPRRATGVAVSEECPLLTSDAGILRRFKDRHRGGRCFIIGNGPSLNRHDLECLRDEITFGVNGIFYKTDETGFRPTYYVVEDSHVIADNLQRINAFEVEQKFFPADYRDMIDQADNVAFFRMNKGFYQRASPTYRTPTFSFDAAERLYCGQSVTYINLQLAFYMGFTEVYLIGMDFSYAIPAGAIIDGMTITSTDDDPNHFHPDYFGKGKKWHDPQLDQVRACYEYAKNVFEEHGRRIYNASKGGKLEVFPRVEYDALLEACAGL